MKIDKRHIYGIMIDTETANDLENPLVYDVGWQVIDSHGRKYLERSFINEDIFHLEKWLMQTAYYKEKVPNYWRDIWNGKRKMIPWIRIKMILAHDIEIYGCKFICAHNARFDNKALNTTQRYLTKSKYRYFLPKGLEWWDTQKMAESLICKRPAYVAWCKQNGYLTARGQVRRTAEILYRFISQEEEFVESHTGLEDVDIERQILAYCVRQHKPMRKKLWND